jgi:hypothetical protein
LCITIHIRKEFLIWEHHDLVERIITVSPFMPNKEPYPSAVSPINEIDFKYLFGDIHAMEVSGLLSVVMRVVN